MYSNEHWHALFMRLVWLKVRKVKMIKVIAQKLKLLINVLKRSLNVLYQALYMFRKTIGHRARLRDVTGQFYPIYTCTRANHERYSSVQVIFCRS